MTTECRPTEHNYFPLKSGYCKRYGTTTDLEQVKTDESIEYAMLCCSRCGHTKEVISADHRKKEE